MKKLQLLALSVLMLGMIACQKNEPSSPGDTPLPTAVQSYMGKWDFAYLTEESLPGFPITLEFISSLGVKIDQITLTLEPDYTFSIIGIPTKPLNGSFVLQDKNLLCTLSAESFEKVKKQFTSDQFLAIYSEKEGKKKVELKLGKLIITECPIPLNNASMFFQK